MNSQPLVSVIVVTYNSADYVVFTLNSIKEQTYKNIELIVSDDGSTDQTVATCKEWLQANDLVFQKTKLLTVDKNSGISANCNRGVKASYGLWVKVIAGDDLLLPTCIEIYMKHALLTGAEFMHSRVRIIDSVGHSAEDDPSLEKIQKWRNKSFNGDVNLVEYLIDSSSICTPSVILTRERLDDMGLYDERFPMLEDCPMFFRLLKAGFCCHGVPEETVAYRVCGESISNTNGKTNVKFKDSLVLFYKEMLLPELFKRRKYIVWFLKLKLITHMQIYVAFGNSPNLINTCLKGLFFPYKSLRSIIGKMLKICRTVSRPDCNSINS